MYVYHPNHRAGLHHLIVAPAALDRSITREDWYEQNESGEMVPKAIRISFANGRCEVDDGLGEFLVAHGFAKRTRLITVFDEAFA